MRCESQNKVLREIGRVVLMRRKFLEKSRNKRVLDLRVDEKQIRRIENGEINFTIMSLLKICAVLDMNYSMFEAIKRDKKIVDF